MQIAFGALLAALVASLAYRARALSAGGAAAAFAVGAVVFASGGWAAAAILFAFFLPSTLLSRIGGVRNRLVARGEREAPRSEWQVLANGGVAAICALAGARGGAPLAAAFAGAFAAASADTWGTEVGTLSRSAPVSILTLRPLRPGLSGGITPLGIVATVAGAFCVACDRVVGRHCAALERRAWRHRRSEPRFDSGRESSGAAVVSFLRNRMRNPTPPLRRSHRAATRPKLDRE